MCVINGVWAVTLQTGAGRAIARLGVMVAAALIMSNLIALAQAMKRA